MRVLVIVSKSAQIQLDHFTAVVTLVTPSLDTAALVRILLNSLADLILSDNFLPQTIQTLYLDIDECSSGNGLSPCQQTCTNTIGSYNCGCISGYALQSNGYNCSGKHVLQVWTHNYTMLNLPRIRH